MRSDFEREPLSSSQNIVELAVCKPLAIFSEVCDAAAVIQAQIYRAWGVAIAKGRMPTGPVGVFGAGRVAAVRTLRETRRLRMEQ